MVNKAGRRLVIIEVLTFKSEFEAAATSVILDASIYR